MTAYTTPPTETLSLGDVVVMGGKKYHVRECMCGRNFTLADSDNIYESDETACKTLEHITEYVRKQFAKIAPKESPKEVPPLAVGQTWRTRGGEIATIRADKLDGYFRADGIVGNAWWYRSHHSSKKMHSPGELPGSHPDTLVELIADAPSPEKSPDKDEVALVLTREEAQAVYELLGCFVVGDGPVRKHTSHVVAKLTNMGFDWVARYPLKICPDGILCIEAEDHPLHLNEVWRTEKKYLVRVCMVRSDGVGFVRTIHNPKDAAIIYGDEGTREVSADGDILASGDKLIEKISD